MHSTMWSAYMKIRVGRIPFLNSEPFYFNLVRDDIELLQMVPSVLSAAAERGEIDAGPVPVVDCFRLEDRFVPLDDFCISTQVKSRSILFYSKRPIEELDGSTIAITGQTSTSRRLLDVLLTHRYKIRPVEYVPLEQENDAFLLIGDEALRRRYGVPSHPHLYDLGEEWHRWTGLPFVFAQWIVRKDLDADWVSYLSNVLYGCVDEALDHVDEICRMRSDVRMSTREVMEYYQGFRYRMGAAEREAVGLFRHYLTCLGSKGGA